MGKLSKKYTRTNKKQNKKRRKTQRVKRVKRGGHEREDVPHYHLNVKTPTDKTIELFALFAKSAKPREGITEISTQSATIGDLKTAIIDKEWGTRWLMDPVNPGKTKPFTLFWKGKALLNDKIKLRDIIVDGERLPLYRHSKEIEPIVIKLDGTFDRSSIVETEVIKHPDPIFKDTPPDE